MSIAENATWIECKVESGIMVVRVLVTHLDKERHPREEYERCIDSAIEKGHERIILDLSKLRTTGHTWGLLQLIFIANRKLKEVGGSLAISGLGWKLRRVLRTANLDKTFSSFKNTNEAIRSLA